MNEEGREMNGMKRNLLLGIVGITLAFVTACNNPFLKGVPQVDGNPGSGNSGRDPVIKNTVSIDSAAVSVTAPAKGKTPVTTAPMGNEGYTCGAVTWSPANSPFLGNTKYTATVTLTARENYIFAEGFTVKINGNDTKIESKTDEEVTIFFEFDETLNKEVDGISIENQPDKLTYTHGDTLDLDGLVVRLTFDDGTYEDFELARFGTTISTVPAGGALLSRTEHNDQPVVVHYGSETASTDKLTVDKAANTQQSGSFNITFEQFTDISDPAYILHSPNIAAFTLSGTYDAGSITWYYNGSPIGTPGSNTLTVNPAIDDHFNKRGVYYITVEAKMNGILYSKRIELTITAP